MDLLRKEILKFAAELVSKYNYFLIDLVVRGNKNNRIIELFIDNKDGVNTDDCSLISKELGAAIDDRNLIESKYRLDVSSPGTDRPLKYLPQFSKHLNRNFKIKFLENEETKVFEGRLIKIDNDDLIFSTNKKERKIKFEKIKSAKVLISF